MSGDLKDPRRSIPRGTISAILVTMVIYIALAYMASRIATPDELRRNQMIMVDKALWGPIVIAGIMGATLSSALSSILGAPRILQALAEQRTVPYSQFFAQTTNNEPRNAIIFTGVLIEIALLLGNLDYLASLITMFFLITYGTLNLVVFLHQGMKFISFRPTFKIPKIIPLVGAIGSIFIMFLINAIFSIIALLIVIFIYFYLGKKGLESEWGDIRGGIFLVLAERASRLSAKFPQHQVSWKPDLLLPIENPKEWSGSLLFIRNITYPSGSIYAFTIKESFQQQTQEELSNLLKPLQDQGILVNSSVIEDNDFLHGAKLVIQTLKGGAFRPNILFLTIGNDTQKDGIIHELILQASRHQMGVIILRQHPRIAFGMQRDINLWLRDKSPNWHLALLITLHLQLNWEGSINLVTASDNKADEKRLYDFLQQLSDQARLPSLTNFHVIIGSFEEALKQAPRADINIFGLAGNGAPLQHLREIPEIIKSSCLFVKDSGYENALA